MKAKPCELWLGTHYKFFKWANFPSVSAAKKYIRECISCYHEIRIINSKNQN